MQLLSMFCVSFTLSSGLIILLFLKKKVKIIFDEKLKAFALKASKIRNKTRIHHFEKKIIEV